MIACFLTPKIWILVILVGRLASPTSFKLLAMLQRLHLPRRRKMMTMRMRRMIMMMMVMPFMLVMESQVLSRFFLGLKPIETSTAKQFCTLDS